MDEEHYIFMVGGEKVGHGNFSSDHEARKHAEQLSERNRYAFVGYYKMISAVTSTNNSGHIT